MITKISGIPMSSHFSAFVYSPNQTANGSDQLMP